MNAMEALAKARQINPTAVTKILAQHNVRVQSGDWPHSESQQIRDNALRALVARGA